MSAAEKIELLELLEEKRRRVARRDLNEYCRYIEIPGVPFVADSCPDGDDCDNPDCTMHEVSEAFYPDTVEPAKHHELINDALMKVARGWVDPETQRKLDRLMIFMPPGSAKSTYATVTYPSWYMGNNPNKNIICTSYGSALAKKFGRKVRTIARSALFSALFGCSLVPDNRAVDDWAMTNGSTYMSGGILSGITGNRADGLIIDDPVKGKEDADSPTIREKTWEAYLTDLDTRLKPGGWQVIIQTRWHEDDLSGRILPETYDGESGWVQARDGDWWYVICLQAQAERDDDPLGRERGEWLWTEYKPASEWERQKRKVGERNWAALYQQRPKPLEGVIFKRHWPNRYRMGELPPDVYLVQSWDTANKPDEVVNAPSVCTTWAVSKLGYYLVHVWRDWVDYPTLKKKAVQLFEEFTPTTVLVEDKASGQSLIQDLRDNTLVPVVAIEVAGDKIFRAEQSTGAWESGLVHLPSDDPAIAPAWLRDFESEIFGFPLSTYKDQVDSVSQAINYIHRHRASGGRLEFASSGRLAGYSAGD